MKSAFRFLPIGTISFALALAVLAAGALRHPGFPPLMRQGFQSFAGVMMLFMQI